MVKYIILGHPKPDVNSIVRGYLCQNYLSRRNIIAEFVIPDEHIDNDTQEIYRIFHLEPNDFQKTLAYNENTIYNYL